MIDDCGGFSDKERGKRNEVSYYYKKYTFQAILDFIKYSWTSKYTLIQNQRVQDMIYHSAQFSRSLDTSNIHHQQTTIYIGRVCKNRMFMN